MSHLAHWICQVLCSPGLVYEPAILSVYHLSPFRVENVMLKIFGGFWMKLDVYGQLLERPFAYFFVMCAQSAGFSLACRWWDCSYEQCDGWSIGGILLNPNLRCTAIFIPGGLRALPLRREIIGQNGLFWLFFSIIIHVIPDSYRGRFTTTRRRETGCSCL